MMKRMSFWLLGMLLNMLPVMASPSDSLTFSNVRTEGVVYAGMPLRVTIEVTNNATEDYYSIWSVDTEELYWDYHKAVEIKVVEIKAGETKDFSFETIIYQAGDLPWGIYDVKEDKWIYNFSIHTEDAQPKLATTIQLDLQEDVTDGSRYAYSDYETYSSVKGKVTITNNDEESILTKTLNDVGPRQGLFRYFFIPHVSKYPVEDEGFTIEGLPDEIKSGETVTGYINFTIEAQPEAGQEYVIQIKYIDTVIATSEAFTFRLSTNTYWKADGTQLPLTVGDNNTLIVPKDAAAVDLRGLYYLGARFKIDVSEANPNCLYYISFIDYVPQGFTSETNIIREDEANVLSIDSNYDFYCPVSFQAKTAFFTYTPVSESRGPASPVMSQRMSGMITVPFDAQKAWLAGTNEYHEDSPFYNEDFKIANQWVIDEDGTIVFWPLTPKAIVSNSCYYLIYDMKPSPLVFYSEDAYIFPGDFGGDVLYSNNRSILRQVSMKTRKAVKNTYSWNCDRNCFVLNEEGATIRPFNVTVGVWDQNKDTLVDTGQEILPYYIDSGEGGLVSIKSTRRTPEDKAIYSISGQRVGTAAYQDGRLCTDGLKPGLYIVGGKKVVVK